MHCRHSRGGAVRVEQTPVRYTVNISVPAVEADVDGSKSDDDRGLLKAQSRAEFAGLRARARGTALALASRLCDASNE